MNVAELSIEALKALARDGDRVALQNLRNRRAMRAEPTAAEYPASPAQWRLWLEAEKQSVERPHVIGIARRVRGRFDERAWCQALAAVTSRHETLHTRFAERDGRLRQIVDPSGGATLIVHDFAAEPDPSVACRDFLRERAGEPIDLRRGPLWEAYVQRLGPADHVLALRIHHIIADAWSLEILQRDLVLFYESCLTGAPDPLPPLTQQYRDFAFIYAAEEFAAARSYFAKKLADPPPPLPLPCDSRRPAVPSREGASVRLTLDPFLLKELRELAARQDATLFMALHATTVLLLHRYTNQTDILLGVPVAGREVAGCEDQVGVFINLLALSDHLDGGYSFKQLLAETARTVREALTHRRYPFDQLVADLAGAWQRGNAPLFNVILALQNVAQADAQLSGLTVGDFPLDAPFVEYDLAFEFAEAEDELVLVLSYATDLFTRETITQLADHYRRVLEGVVASPERAVGRLELVGAEERHRLAEWNATERGYPGEVSLGSLYRAQAAARPEAVAVRWNGGELSYGALEAWSNRVAMSLRSRYGAGSEQPVVGVFVDRGAAWIASLLGVVKSGGAYLPLDVEEPVARLAYMLRDAGARVVVATTAVRDRLPSGLAEVVEVEEDWPGGWASGEATECGGSSGLCDVHLGLDGGAEGGVRFAPRGSAAGLQYGLPSTRPRGPSCAGLARGV